jgi:anti-anti-sigma factor
MDELGPKADPPASFTGAIDADGNAVVTITGELDISGVDALEARVAPLLDRRPPRLVVDASGLRFADSSAIALWVKWAAAVPEIELRRAPALLRRVVDSMGLTETLNVTP